MTKLAALILPLGLILTLSSTSQATVTFDFTSQDSFDGETVLNILILDGDTGFSTTMTLTASGGTFNSNSGDFGIDGVSGTNDLIDGTAESITINFEDPIEFNFIDLGGVNIGGGSGLDAASLTIGDSTTVLQTGVENFDGTSDIYTPALPISLSNDQSIMLTGADSTSVIDLETINVTVIPERKSYALLVGFFALAPVILQRRGVN